MGSGASTANDRSPQTISQSETPIRFSEGFVNSLQSSNETDSTRAKNQELLIQSRVTSELEKHLASSQSKLSSLSESISTEHFEQRKGSLSSDQDHPNKPLLNRIAEFFRGGDQSDQARKNQREPNSDLDSNVVSKEVEDLRRKLDSRKRLVESDKDIEQAKDAVVNCLKNNDQRPLDCWREVEKFKLEVGRLERMFVEKSGG